VKTVLLFPNEHKDRELKVTRSAARVLNGAGVTCLIPERFSDTVEGAKPMPLENALEQAGLVISIGGDGTLLLAAPFALRAGLPLLGVNAGRTGFLTELEAGEIDMLCRIPGGEYSLDRRILLDAQISRAQGGDALNSALNDVVVTRGESAQTIFIDLLVDGRVMNSFFADGLIAATPTGSTGYCMSAGGPIVEPSAECIVITPICPHALYARSFVLDSRREIIMRPKKLDERPAFVTVDGANPVRLCPGGEVRVTRSSLRVDICRLKDRQFYDIINEKLKYR
jgi:NAD+ kinase